MLLQDKIDSRTLSTFNSQTLRTVVGKASVGKLINQQYQNSLTDSAITTLEKIKKSTKKLSYVDELRKSIKSSGIPFNFSDKLLEEVIDILKKSSYEIRLVDLREAEDEIIDLYNNDFLTSLPDDKYRSIFNRAIPDDKRAVACVLSQEGDPQKTLTYVSVDFDTFLWTPIVPTDILFEHDIKIDFYQVIDKFENLVADHFEKKPTDRGMVRVIGPRGGEFLCGEVCSTLERTQIKDKTIDLDNSYKISIYI